MCGVGRLWGGVVVGGGGGGGGGAESKWVKVFNVTGRNINLCKQYSFIR